MNETDENWVTLSTYSWLSDAQVARSLLEANDIVTMIPEENTVGVIPYMTAMQVRILVRKKDLPLAKELLSSGPAESDPAVKTDHTSANWFRAILGFFFGVPMRRK